MAVWRKSKQKKKAFTHLVRRQNFAVLNDLVGCFFFRTGNMSFANVVPFAWKGTIRKVGSKSWRQMVRAHMPLASRDLEGQSYDAWRKESVLSRRLVIKFVLWQLASPWSNYDGPSRFFRKSEEAYKLFLFCFRYQSWALREIDKTRLTINLSYSGLLIPFEREQITEFDEFFC